MLLVTTWEYLFHFVHLPFWNFCFLIWHMDKMMPNLQGYCEQYIK